MRGDELANEVMKPSNRPKKGLNIPLPFATSYLCEAGFSAMTATKPNPGAD